MIVCDQHIWIKYINTKQQTADIFTKGRFSAARWSHLCDLAQLRGSNLPSTSSKTLLSGNMFAAVPAVMMAQQGHAAAAVGAVTPKASGHATRKSSLPNRSVSCSHRKEHKRSDGGSAGGHTSHSRTRKRNRDRKKRAREPSSDWSIIDPYAERNPFGFPGWWTEDEKQLCWTATCHADSRNEKERIFAGSNSMPKPFDKVAFDDERLLARIAARLLGCPESAVVSQARSMFIQDLQTQNSEVFFEALEDEQILGETYKM